MTIEVKPVAVEDLLGRPQAVLDRPAMQQLDFQGCRVLVTGAGGTIGSELARQIAALGLRRELGLVDSSEFNLYSIDLEITEAAPEIKAGLGHMAHLADVRDRSAMAAVFAEAPARTRVPRRGPQACARSWRIPRRRRRADQHRRVRASSPTCAASTGARIMVLISTDKAVNPTSAMGATKRVAESYCQALDRARTCG